MAAKTTSILYVPGAWHKASTFNPVATLLEEAGYRVDLIDLPSVGPAKHLPNFDADVEVIRSHIQKACDAGREIVLIGHSYGSIPASEAAKGLDLSSRQKEGKAGGVKHLVFCCAFIVDEGHSLIGAFGGSPLPWFKISEDQLEVNPDTPEKIFYNDVADNTTEEMIRALRPQSYQVMHTPVTYAAWKHIPSTYIYTTQDAAIPLQIQQMMVETVAKGYPINTDTVDAGHSPFLSKPKETAEAIRRAAGEYS
ncbi:hypothetical protein M409DRAFT_69642 [Zasmidium cellare ATCC 36951]|uniref:AB hydrolase-1 domain-containing protein n=1 Tax=Zasmidium cellare ATCC 36951 TaxID=1080233 RepID=A0A6A6C6Z6_ZASCE|nr:uncharacterized protein M409DRAFT_69642 [Zasmidium cellare ATCC 36951]KAF2161519.1 hypothetical protein M409DRAFT_69642 [Zasmidium cellare ATCC 36951]